MSASIKESYFWQQVKTGLEDFDVHLCRVENTAGSGISDINACSNGREVWIELKVFHGNQVYFRNSQRAWIARRDRVGGRVLVLARRDNDLLLFNAVDLVMANSRQILDKNSFSIHRSDLPAPLYECHKPFRWEEIKLAIFGD